MSYMSSSESESSRDFYKNKIGILIMTSETEQFLIILSTSVVQIMETKKNSWQVYEQHNKILQYH